jgi:hypothetical protein
METTLNDIVELLFPDYIGIGTLMRLRRTNVTIYKTLDLNYTGWFSFFKKVKMKWLKSFKERFNCNKTMWFIDKKGKASRKKSFSTMVIQDLLPLRKRCRECGHANGLNTLNFYVCSKCANEKGGYSELISSANVREIVTNAGHGWKRKLPSNFLSSYNPPLKVIRRTVPFRKRLYWAHDAILLKKKYESKRKNVKHEFKSI